MKILMQMDNKTEKQNHTIPTVLYVQMEIIPVITEMGNGLGTMKMVQKN